MYSVRRDLNNSYYYSQYWTMNCQQQHEQFIFNNRQMIKAKQHYFWSTKFYNNKDCHTQCQTLNNNSIKSTDLSNSHDMSLPIYRAPCTFQNSLITTSNDGHSHGVCLRSPLSSSSSSCVPDVYSPGLISSGNCSPPPPSSNLPPPPSEWLN
ncbi:unnamed protein product [Rotaria sordida]|uniref:Uncharacterized protein n=3 Tax=Rotaria sordida TaxID=392033 RepID=A0A815QTB7_9BILA|nr:unnamed protein product [Rotaria sordida]CAF1468076.1 unnamed protein product [Rotaria sordida]CAF1500391.1 unnamed protein product [Rotaria sordida]CAF1644154.1 unnamed protein product [Rotaria sordida]CAF3500892.1 unnamed protein product [Rotaria sordida]